MSHDIIITGGTGLIGKPVVDYFTKKRNLDVLAVSRETGWDLTDGDQVEDLFEEHQARYLINLFGLDSPVKKASELEDQNFMNVSLASFRQFMEVNVTALFDVCREWAVNNTTNGGIINFSSVYGVISPDPYLYEGRGDKHPAYGASKAAVIQLSKYLATHLAPLIRVNTIVLGGVETPDIPERFRKSYEVKTPKDRMAQPQDLFGILELLCSDKSQYITGSTITVDGGYTAL